MKNIFLALCAASLFLTGCGSHQTVPAVEQAKLSDKFQLKNVSLTLTESVTPKTEYHSEGEFQTLIQSGIQQNLTQADLLTSDTSANSIDIKITYKRQFMLDATPFPADALRYPSIDYVINVTDGDKTIRTITRNDFMFRGGIFTPFKIMFGVLNEKDDESIFITALNKKLAKEIQSLE
ncbi:MAG: hypothetical protein H7A09_02710 [Oceanospirillaceae bacterium]|nr:hypothetical protein [Oceanospirillaceae bacterium]MCP5351162.1 hypothetical protein [Oceanospirillaceae bacterium]